MRRGWWGRIKVAIDQFLISDTWHNISIKLEDIIVFFLGLIAWSIVISFYFTTGYKLYPPDDPEGNFEELVFFWRNMSNEV